MNFTEYVVDVSINRGFGEVPAEVRIDLGRCSCNRSGCPWSAGMEHIPRRTLIASGFRCITVLTKAVEYFRLAVPNRPEEMDQVILSGDFEAALHD